MKLQDLQKILKEKKIDLLLLIHPDPSITYIAEIEPSFSVLQVTEHDAKILLSNLDNLSPSEGITKLIYKKEWKEDLKEQFSKHKNLTIAINKSVITVKQFEALKKELPSTNWVDVTETINKLRLTKTEEEITLMKRAAEIADTALKDFVKEYKKDATLFPTEISVALFLEKRIKEQGAIPSFPTIVATRKNSATPHHKTSTEKLQEGFLLIDMGAKYKGYCSDMTRMFSIGDPSKEEQDYYNLLLKIQEACIKKAKKLTESKKSLEILDAFAREQLKDQEKLFLHSLGHGIGVEIHEAPRIAKGCSQIIEKNMPFTIEPGIYRKGKWGIRIEDTVVWDGDKVQMLTKSPKELKIL